MTSLSFVVCKYDENKVELNSSLTVNTSYTTVYCMLTPVTREQGYPSLGTLDPAWVR